MENTQIYTDILPWKIKSGKTNKIFYYFYIILYNITIQYISHDIHESPIQRWFLN